jgi:molybdate transport system ATP-binding protein
MKLEVAVRKQFAAFSLEANFTLSDSRVGVFGDSGSGKSTLVNLIAGLEKPDQGEIRLDGDYLFSHARNIDLAPERRHLAMVFQQAHLFPHLSVKENLLFGWHRRPPAERRIHYAQLVEVLRLGELLSRGVNHLSGGEQQRVAIGRAVLSNPRLLILDEPLSALDEHLKVQIIAYLNEVRTVFDIPFLFISHSLRELRLLTDVVLRIDQGRAMDLCKVEWLARRQMAAGGEGYMNLLRLTQAQDFQGLTVSQWGRNPITTTMRGAGLSALFELSSKDIILFKQHPEAISARNLLQGVVREIFEMGNKLGVELDCGGENLVIEIVRSAADELGVRPGAVLFAAFKASAIRLLGE